MRDLPWVFNSARVELSGYGQRTDITVFDKECPCCSVFITTAVFTNDLTNGVYDQENIYLQDA